MKKLLPAFFALAFIASCSISGGENSKPTNVASKPESVVTPGPPNPAESPSPSPTVSSGGDDAEYVEHFHKALTLAESDKDAAIAEMELALQARPNDRVALKWIADWYSTLKRPEEEANIYRRWTEAFPEDERGHGLLSNVLVRELKQYREGLAETNAAQLFCVGRMCYVYDKQIAEAYEGLNDYPHAVEHYQLFLKGAKKDGDPNPHTEISKKIIDLLMKHVQN